MTSKAKKSLPAPVLDCLCQVRPCPGQVRCFHTWTGPRTLFLFLPFPNLLWNSLVPFTPYYTGSVKKYEIIILIFMGGKSSVIICLSFLEPLVPIWHSNKALCLFLSFPHFMWLFFKGRTELGCSSVLSRAVVGQAYTAGQEMKASQEICFIAGFPSWKYVNMTQNMMRTWWAGILSKFWFT